MPSADIWRVGLPSRISRILSRGPVTLSPALRRSLLSKPAVSLKRSGMMRHHETPCTINDLARRGFRPDEWLRLQDEHPAGQLPGRRVSVATQGRHDAQPGALPAG